VIAAGNGIGYLEDTVPRSPGLRDWTIACSTGAVVGETSPSRI
jgi:hypothetical protein